MKQKHLFHGTQIGNIKEFEPRISLDLTNKYVYATDDYAYALVRAGKQLDLIREEYYGFEKPFELAECYPHSIGRMFDCSGYIYLFNPDDFEDHVYEFVSDKPVKPIDCIFIENIWMEMLKNASRYEIIWHGNEEYWKGVRGGREGFLKRKLETKRKLNELLKKAQV